MHEDGSVTWTDHKGTTIATTVPHGPIAHINRQTFDQRATRLTATIRGANARRLRAETDAAAARERPTSTPRSATTPGGPRRSSRDSSISRPDRSTPPTRTSPPRPLGPDPTIPF